MDRGRWSQEPGEEVGQVQQGGWNRDGSVRNSLKLMEVLPKSWK